MFCVRRSVFIRSAVDVADSCIMQATAGAYRRKDRDAPNEKQKTIPELG